MSLQRKELTQTQNAQLLSTSKFKNIKPEITPKTQWITNLKLNTQNENTLQISSQYYGVPWKSTGDGLMYIGMMNKPERVSDKPKLLKAHNSQITTFNFSPFHERMMMTGGRDGIVKIWDLPESMEFENLQPTVSIQHEKRITHSLFHPLADNIITTASDDGIVSLYDLTRAEAPVIQLSQNQNKMLSLSWEGGFGNNMMTICEDLNYRLYDPRDKPDPICTFTCGETVKGLKGLFIDGTDYFVTTGFSKGGDRVINMFDQRKEGMIGRTKIDVQPHPLNMYYDDNNNLLYLTGKGTTMFVYDILGSNIVNITKANLQEGVAGCAMIPQRLYDVKKCEVGRFLLLNTKADTLYTASFSMNRKNADSVFHEDLYQNVKNEVAEYTSESWLMPDESKSETKITKSSQHMSKYNKDTQKRSTYSMQPLNMKSVFELTPEEGGKDRGKELLMKMNLQRKKKMKKIKYSGAFEEMIPGWFYNSYLLRWYEMNEKQLMFFTNKDDPKPSTTISFRSIKSFKSSDPVNKKYPIIIELEEQCEEVLSKKALPKYTYFVQSESDAYEWILSYQILRKLFEEKVERDEIKKEKEPPKQEETKRKTKEELKKEEESKYEVCGRMYMIKPNWWSTIKRKFLYIEKGVLYSQNVTWWGQQPTGYPEMECFLNRIIHLSESEGIFPASYKNTFQLTTKGNVFHFACDNEKDKEKWMKACTPNALKGDDEEEELADFKRTPAQEGMQYYVSGLFGGFTPVFVTLVANEIFVFKNKTDTNPMVKIYLQEINDVEINKETEEMTIVMEEKDKKVMKHRFKTSEYEVWKEEILDRKKRTIDLLSELGIRDELLTLDNAINEEYVNKTSQETDQLFQDTNNFYLRGEPAVMLHIKGRRRVHPHVVSPKQEQLNPYNSYVYIGKEGLFCWKGQVAPQTNSTRSSHLTDKIVQKERGRCAYKIMNHGKEDNDESFWKKIGCEPTPYVKGAKRDTPLDKSLYKNLETTDEQDKQPQDIIRIYRIMHNENNENNPLTVSIVHENGVNMLPPKEILKKGSVSIVTTSTEIYVWQSTTSTLMAKKIGSIIASKLYEQIKPLIMIKLNENGEILLFKIKFSNYPDTLPIQMTTAQDVKVKETEKRPQKDKELMIQEIQKNIAPHFTEPLLNTNGKMIFEAMTEGTYTIKRIEDHNIVAYPKELFGHFFTKDAFLVQYSFYPEGSDKQQHILYFWLGRDASVMDMGTLARKVIETSEGLETSVQIRVPQGKEPREFLKMFKGKYIVHLGGYTEYYAKRPEVYEIRGKEENLCKMVQVTLPSQLQKQSTVMKMMPGSVYLFKTHKEISVMKGKYCNKEQEKMIEMASKEFELPVVYKEEVCKNLVGGCEWINEVEKSQENYNQIRLFRFTYWITAIEIDEIEQANQRDLQSDYVFMIDAGKVWLWFGKKSENIPAMRIFSVDFALKYALAKGYKSVKVETQNEESSEFRGLFEAWGNTDLLRKNNLRQEYAVSKKEIIDTIISVSEGTFTELEGKLKTEIVVEGKTIKSAKAAAEDMIKIENVEVDRKLVFPQIENREKVTEEDAQELADKYSKQTYTYQELTTKPRPYGVDTSKLEAYLSDEEFQTVFGMSKEEFYKMKPWCRDKLKHSAYLY